MTFDEFKTLKQFLNYKLVPRGKKVSKVPFYANGKVRGSEHGTQADRDQLVTFDEARAVSSLIGFASLPGDGIVALDFDNVVKAGVIQPDVAALIEGTYAEFSPSGNGIRAFMAGKLASRKDTQGEPFPVEFFCGNGFVTITGNLTPDCQMWGLDNTICDLTPAVLELFRTRFGEVQEANAEYSDDDLWLLSLTPKQGWTLEQASEYLNDCDPSTDRDHWLKAGMALHHEFDGSTEAFELYDQWSAKGDNYGGTKDVMGRWRSFGKRTGSDPVTARWLMRWRDECRTVQKYSRLDEWKQQITAAPDEFSLRESVCPKIVADPLLGEIEREALAQALLAAFKAKGLKLPIATCRKLVAKPRHISTFGGENHPDWLLGYVFVTDDDKFYRAGEWMTAQGFNAAYNRYMPRDENGMVTISASVAALEHYQIQVVKSAMYAPMLPGTFQDAGDDQEAMSWYVNTYRDSSVPKAAVSISPEAQAAIDMLRWHIVNLTCSGRQREADIFTSWLAHCVQKPGEKIRWAPLIKGIEGDGKSLYGTLMECVMGAANVKTVSPTVICTDFTSWAVGGCVCLIEELRLAGHNRHDAHNRLKPMITNDRIEVHPKGKDSYVALNTMNQLIFTNFSDALPLSDTDRRFFIIFTRFAERKELEACLLQWGGADAYFAKLIGYVKTYFREIRRFLLDWKMHPEFSANGVAPMTSEKSVMVRMSRSDDEVVLSEVIAAGGVGISSNVIASSSLRAALTMTDADMELNNYEFGRLMMKAGYLKFPTRVFWGGKTQLLWYRGNISSWNPGLKQILDETLKT